MLVYTPTSSSGRTYKLQHSNKWWNEVYILIARWLLGIPRTCTVMLLSMAMQKPKQFNRVAATYKPLGGMLDFAMAMLKPYRLQVDGWDSDGVLV